MRPLAFFVGVVVPHVSGSTLEPATFELKITNHLSGAVHAIQKRFTPVHSFSIYEIVSIRHRASFSRDDSSGDDSADGG
jgi:hypothetical protein